MRFFFGGREILHVLNRHAALLKHVVLLSLKQAPLLKILLRVLVLIMHYALHAYIHFRYIFLMTQNSQKR